MARAAPLAAAARGGDPAAGASASPLAFLLAVAARAPNALAAGDAVEGVDGRSSITNDTGTTAGGATMDTDDDDDDDDCGNGSLKLRTDRDGPNRAAWLPGTPATGMLPVPADDGASDTEEDDDADDG